MSLIRSKYTFDFDNRPLDPSIIHKIKLSPPSPKNKRLWILRFYGLDESRHDKVLRSWFYTTEWKRKDDLQSIVKKNSQIMVWQAGEPVAKQGLSNSR
jgi:hypothetical protein